MRKYDRKSLLAAGLAGLVFAAGSSAQRPDAGLETQPGWLAKQLRAMSAAAKRSPASPRFRAPVQAVKSNDRGLQLGSKTVGAKSVGRPTGRYFVRLASAPVVSRLSMQRPSGSRTRLDVQSSAAVSYETQLRNEQTQALQRVSNALGRSVVPRVQLTRAINGFSIDASPAEAERIAALPGVSRVTPVMAHKLDTDVGPAHIGAPNVWNGTASGTATLGEGIVAGIIDSGINSNHPSFAATAGAFTHTNPLPGGVYLGWCATNPGFCNDKLIGAYDFVFDLVDGDPDVEENASPEDNNSHGSHTASTVAGNPIEVDFEDVTDLPISGVAPHANIIAYDTCYNEISTGLGLCPDDATAAAVEQAITDGVVDVINFSIGGGDDPYNDIVSEAFLSAVESGIYIATSVGNDGPDAATVGHNEPWVAGNGAMTHNRDFVGGVSVTGPTTPPELQDIAYVQGTGDDVTVDITDDIATSAVVAPGNVNGCAAFAANAFQGKIALIERGGCDFVVKVRNAQAAGAVAVIIRNQLPGAPFIQGGLDEPDITIPSVMIRRDPGIALSNYIAANPTATVRIDADPSYQTNLQPDVMADFSSRGPGALDVIKPDTAAPGVNILAAVADGFGTVGQEVGLLSGTSMASPHNAGSAALLRDLQPTWTPMEVKSALMLTAETTDLFKEDETTPADPFDVGNGRLRVDVAARAGLVMDETIANFEDANPDDGGDPRTLNIASLMSSNCIATANCSFTRTFRNPTANPVTWNITVEPPEGVTMTATPSSFTINAGATQVVEFEGDATDRDPADGFGFGRITLSDNGGVLDDLHLEMALQASSGVLPETVTINTRRDAGSQEVTGLITPPATDLTFIPSGLVRGTLVQDAITEDTDNGSAFDDPTDGTYFALITPETFGLRFVAEITATDAADLDLFLGLDLNGDGQPQADEVFGSSATSSALERAELRELCAPDFPPCALPSGFSYWILVQNWEGSSAGATDDFTMHYAFVEYGSAGNLDVEAPTAPAAGEPYDARFFWNEPAMSGGERWYGAFDVGGTPSGAVQAEFGTIGVDVIRGADDVTKQADVAGAAPGDTVSYTITVQPNVTPEALVYEITDTLPAGMQLVPASVTASQGTVDVTGQTITWNLTMGLAGFDYLMTDSANDATCAMPLADADATVDAYLNVSDFGINPTMPANDGPFGFNVSGVNGGLPFYQSTVKSATLFGSNNGVLSVDVNSILSAPVANGTNLPIPSAGLPDSILALLWNDMTLTGAPPGSGRTAVNLEDDNGNPVGFLIEYDNLMIGNAANTIDAEIYFDSRVLANAPEIVFAYANPTGSFTSLMTGTIGLENADGSRGVQYAYNDVGLQVPSGSAICFDLVQFGSAETLTFDAVVQPGTSGTVIVNDAVHEVDNPGSVAATASAAVTIDPADLSITKTDNATSVLAGESLTYSIVVSNDSTFAAAATVTDTFAAPLQSCSWTCAGSGGGNTCGAGATGNISDNITLAAGGSVTYTATCDVPANATGTATNTATVSYAADPDTSNNSDTDTTTVVPQVDFAITKTDGVAAVNAGGQLVYTIVASNTSTATAVAEVSDDFPASLTCSWTCAGTGGNTCGAANGTGDLLDSPTLVGGGSVTYTATCAVPANAASGDIVNTATIAGPNDPDDSDNEAEDTTAIRAATDLAISKTDSMQVVGALGTATYNIVAINLGTGTAVGAVVTDDFPAPLTCEWTCTGSNGGSCSASGSGDINDTVTLAPGGSVAYQATCQLNNFPGATLMNTATVTYANDTNTANNSATDTDSVTPAEDVIFGDGFEG